MVSWGSSSILDLGFDLHHKTVQATSELGWRQLATASVIELLAIAVLIVLALIAINLLLAMASASILLYTGIFLLGFGGSSWTAGMAINYYKTVLGVAAQLMVMVILAAISGAASRLSAVQAAFQKVLVRTSWHGGPRRGGARKSSNGCCRTCARPSQR